MRTTGKTTTRPRRRTPLLPHQHGAWAFLALPVALALIHAGWSPLVLLLLPAWVAAYPLSWAVAELASARRPARYRRAAMLWLAVVTPFAAALLVVRPWLWTVGLGYAVLFAVNIVFARAGSERSLANDLVLVVECTAMVPVTVAVASDSTPFAAVRSLEVAVLSALCALTLVGSTLHVKSRIRERRNPAYRRAGQGFAVLCVPLSVALAGAWGSGGGWLVLPFLLLALRSWVPDMRRWRPARVGLVELGGFVLVAVAATLAV